MKAGPWFPAPGADRGTGAPCTSFSRSSYDATEVHDADDEDHWLGDENEESRQGRRLAAHDPLMTRVARVVVAIGLSLTLVCAATAQELVSFHGRVLFVAGTTMGFAPDSGSSFEVDLTRVAQSSYEFLNNGDSVTVVGYVSRDGNKVIAVSITPDQ